MAEPPSTAVVDRDDPLSSAHAGPQAVRGGALRGISFVVGSLFGLVAVAILFHHLNVVDTGRYATALSLAALVTGLTDLGLTTVGMRELAVLSGERRASLASNLLSIRLVLTTIGVLIITIFALISYEGILAAGVLIAGLGVLVSNTQATMAIPLMASLRLGWVSLLDLLRALITSILIVTLVAFDAGLLAYLAVSAVSAAIILVPTASLVQDVALRPSFQWARWRALLRPVLVYSFAVAAATLYLRVALVLVSLVSGARQLGYFGLSFRVVEVLFVLPGLLVSSAFPIFARAAHNDPERLGYALSRVFEVALIVGVWLSLSLAVGAHLAIQIVGGLPRYLPSVPILAVQGIGLGATFVSTVWGYGMLSLHLHRLILVFTLGSLLVVSAVVAAMTALDGAIGAAIGASAVEVGVAVVSGLLLIANRPHLRPRLTVVPKVGLAALLGASMMFAQGAPVIVRLVLATALYGAVLLLWKALPEELGALKGAWPARRR
jgi:O-antigen/teichoic acid export membrane protein